MEGRFIHEYGLKDHALLVYGLLREFTLRDGGYIDSTKKLSEMTGFHQTTIRSVIRSLEMNGLLHIEKMLDADRRVVKILKIIKL